jgi:hypothetical protein
MGGLYMRREGGERWLVRAVGGKQVCERSGTGVWGDDVACEQRGALDGMALAKVVGWV